MSRVLVVVGLVGCTQDFGVFVGGDASTEGSPTPNDGATLDVASPVDAGTDTNSGGFYACNQTSVASCAACPGMPEPCVYCGVTDASDLSGICRAAASSCGTGVPNGFQVCGCVTAATCPEPFQVCRNGACRSCGENVGTAGQTCRSGGTCRPDGGCS